MAVVKHVALLSLSSLAAAALLAGCGSADEPSTLVTPDQSVSTESKPDVLPETASPNAIAWTKDEQKQRNSGTGGPGSGANMVYHGGKILTTAVSKAIFWGKSWGTYTGDKMTGIDAFYTGFSGSNYAKASDEYTGSNGQVGATITHQGHVVDTSTASGGGNASTILAEVCKEISAQAITVDANGNGYYPVYTDVPRGSAKYCAWHSAGTCGGKALQFAFFFDLDGDPGCDPQDTVTKHSQGLAALANVSAHELSEARTDPTSPAAWYDRSGQENGDKCAWTFNVPTVAFSDGNSWKVQGEWSNAAYTAGTGYPNLSGLNGCLDGH
jgi:hypothetical protein